MEEKLVLYSNKNVKGSLTVETLLFLIPFMLAFCTVINMARVVEAEVIIHHAITQTAKEISTYSYVMTKTGITKQMQSTHKESAEFKKKVDDTVNSIQEFTSAFGDVSSSTWLDGVITTGQTAEANIEAFVSDPSAIASGVFSWIKSGCEDYGMTLLAGALAKSSIKKQLSLISDDPNEYLENIGVVGGLNGLDFSKSKWNSNTGGKGNIDIVVTFTLKNQLFPDFDFGEHEYMLSVSTLSW